MTNDTQSSNKIEYNDIVEYIGPTGEDNTDLKIGAEYRVLKVSSRMYDIVNDKADFRIRLSVYHNWVRLLRKNPLPKVEKLMEFQQVVTCECGEENALVLQGDKYTGDCICGKHLEVERKVAVMGDFAI